jgi:alpha-1,2-mannosyltransferase
MRAAILLTLIACLATAAYAVRVRDKMPDFEVYRTAGARAAAGQPLYRASDEHYQFKYFPASAFVFTPFAALPVGTAKPLWFALCVGLLAVLLALSVQQLPSRTVPASIIAIGTIVTLGKFYAHELELGQANLLFGVIAMAAVAQLHRGRGIGAGATFGSAAIIKPYALLFLPYLLATRQFRAAAACSAILLVALAAPAIAYGLHGNLDLLVAWWNTATSSTLPNLTNQDNVSIAAMYAKWLGPGSIAEWLAIVTNVALLGACAAVVVMRRRAAAPEYLEVALLLTAITLLSPQGWDYVLLLSTPAVVLLIDTLPRLNRLLQSATIACLALIGLTIYDVMGRAAYARFMALSIITLVYGFVIAMLVYVRAKQLH